MDAEAATLDTGRQKEARKYARIRRRLFIVELLLGGAYLGLWIGLGWNLRLQGALEALGNGGSLPFPLPWWGVLLLFVVLLSLPWMVLTFPLDYFQGFILPHRFGISNQTLGSWISDLLKGLAVSALLGAPILIVLFALIRNMPESWWFWTAAVYTLFTTILTALAPILLMPIFFKFEPLSEEYAELRRRLLDLAAAAGTRVRGVFKFDMSRRTKAANAALAGLGGTRRIVLGDTLLTGFSSDEIETVMAHELAHHVHRDIPLMLFAHTVFNFLGFFLAFIGLRFLAGPLSLESAADPAVLPILAFIFGSLGFLLMPLSNAFSRWREGLADEYALNITRKPEAFASAMTRLANQNLADVDPEQWVVYLFHSHPPLRDRIARARRKSGVGSGAPSV